MKFIFFFLFISCNAIQVITGGETKLSDNFFNQDRNSSQLGCPTGYTLVTGNPGIGTNDFCVMVYEAKNISGVATSEPNTSPWVSITALQAKTLCTNLGARFDLISNPEWMTIARDIESSASNWPSGSVGSGCLTAGNVGTNNACAYINGAIDFGGSRNPLASHTLSNGSVIWDLSGNVAEWVDWTLGGDFNEGPTTCVAGATQLNTVSCSGLLPDDYLPQDTSLSTANCIGNFNGGSFGAAWRGGVYSMTCTGAGLYDLAFQSPSYSAAALGFRCVYR